MTNAYGSTDAHGRTTRKHNASAAPIGGGDIKKIKKRYVLPWADLKAL